MMRNPVYEQELDRQGVKWAYLEKVPLRDFNLKAGLANQARLEVPLVEELVAQYAALYREGSEAPPVVVYKKGPRYVPMDGNHRLAGAERAGVTRHDCYVVDSADPQVLDRLTWGFNNHVNGLRMSPEDCLQHAITMVRKYGMQLEPAAKEWGLPKWKVKQAVQHATLRERLEAHPDTARVYGKLAESTLARLCPLLEQGDDVLVPVTKALATTGASNSEADELVKKVRRARTFPAKQAEIAAYESSDKAAERRAETKGGTIKRTSPSPRDQLGRLLGQTRNLLDRFPDPKTFHPGTREETKRAHELAHEVCRRLYLIYGLATMDQVPEVS
jgi:ParB-like chromosome segregation protein Spo0J